MDISARSNVEKLGEVLRRSVPLMPAAAGREVTKLLSSEAIAVMAAVLVAWVAAHFVGVGEVIDIVLAVAGVFAIGMAVFDGIEELWKFAEGTLRAREDGDLDRAAGHFAAAIAILGIQAALAILFKSRPRTHKGPLHPLPPEPPRNPSGWFASPALRSSRCLIAGEGETSPWGEIIISRFGTSTDRRLAALHESVHRFLTPKFALLREFRVRNRIESYSRSALRRYIEEALAESVAQVSVNGFRSVFRGISFPVRGRYVSVVRASKEAPPFVPEIGGLLASGFMLAGMTIELWETYGPPRLSTPAP